MDDTALTAANNRLTARLRLAERLLRSGLAQAVAAHDLTRAQLVGVEANARRQNRAGVTVSADEFWTQTAQPQAAVLLAACQRIQNEAGCAIVERLWRHGREVAAIGPEPDDVDRCRDMVEAEVRRLGPALIAPTSINALGQWWQNRLRRRAMVLAAPGSLLKPTSHFPLLVTERELELARRPPWSHGDRLLAAFELAHADLRTHAADIEQDLMCQAEVLVDMLPGRDSSATPVNLGFGTLRPPTRWNRGNDRPTRGQATRDGPPAMIELP